MICSRGVNPRWPAAVLGATLLLGAHLALAQAPATPPTPETPPARAADAPAARPADAARPAPPPAAATRPAPPPAAATRPADAPADAARPAPPPAAAARPAAQVAKPKPTPWEKIWKVLKRFELGALWYLTYHYGHGKSVDGRSDVNYNDFRVTRGYLDVKFKPTSWFEARITPDVTQDELGDFKVRLKYIYAKLKLPKETLVVSEPFVEFGQVHMPWLDFEEHVNYFRMQGTMFAERQDLFNSSDVGLTVGVLLGRKLPAKVIAGLHDHYPGTWGSLMVGVYNGTGYHALEKNMNKVIEGRATLRPLGLYHPNLQLSYFFVWGHGNVTAEDAAPGEVPAWWHHQVMASYTHKYFVATAQYLKGRGRQKGDWVDTTTGESTAYQGASGFLEVKLPWIWSSVIGRYDWFEGPNAGTGDSYQRLIVGYALHFLGTYKQVLLFDFDWSMLQGVKDQWSFGVTLQVNI